MLKTDYLSYVRNSYEHVNFKSCNYETQSCLTPTKLGRLETFLACEQALRVALAAGREKEGRVWNI